MSRELQLSTSTKKHQATNEPATYPSNFKCRKTHFLRSFRRIFNTTLFTTTFISQFRSISVRSPRIFHVLVAIYLNCSCFGCLKHSSEDHSATCQVRYWRIYDH